jgi:uroporphyrinogen III methyltransferase / synthase
VTLAGHSAIESGYRMSGCMNEESGQPGKATPISNGPLDGRTVLITRQVRQAGETVARLQALGASVISCPTIQTIAQVSWDRLDSAIEAIDRYGWIVFTSSNGVTFFMERLAQLDRGPSTISGLTTVAIGPGTAGALKGQGIDANVVATDSRAEGALEAIIEHAGGEGRIRGQRFLLCRAAVARDLLPLALRELGAEVDDVETYRTIRPEVDVQPIIQKLKEGAVDAIAFTSSSTLANFADLVGPTALPVLLQGVVVGCIGPATARTAEAYGLTAIVQPQVHTVSALIDSLAEALTSRPL